MKNKFNNLIFGAVWLGLICTGCTNYNGFSSQLPALFVRKQKNAATEITKTSEEYNIIVEIAPAYCSVENIQQVYDLWEKLFDDEEEKLRNCI